jgi:predicted CoA-binding protein
MNENAATANLESYSDDFIRGILQDTKVVALVGASSKWARPSFFVMKYLQSKGYRVIPVNPREAGNEILGEKVYAGLKDIPEPVDMVDCFRAANAIPPIAAEAIEIGAKILWMQLGIRNEEATKAAEAAGLKVVQNRCPKIEYARLTGEIGYMGFNTGVVSSRRSRRI